MLDSGARIPKKNKGKEVKNATRTTARSAHANEINKAATESIKAASKRRRSCEVEIRELPREAATAAPWTVRWPQRRLTQQSRPVARLLS